MTPKQWEQALAQHGIFTHAVQVLASERVLQDGVYVEMMRLRVYSPLKQAIVFVRCPASWGLRYQIQAIKEACGYATV